MTINVERDNDIALLRFARAEKKNAFTEQMYLDFAQQLRNFDADDSVKVIVICGEGGDFSSGNDLSHFLSLRDIDPQSVADPERSPPAIAVDALIHLDTPVVAAVEGCAVGFGATMLLHFDRVVMAEGAYLLYPFSNIGAVPEACCSLLLPKIVGSLRARKLLLDPQPIQAEQAASLGLATDTCAHGQALASAMTIAQAMCARSANSLRASKRLLRGDTQALVTCAREEFESFAECLKTPEAQQALKEILSRH